MKLAIILFTFLQTETSGKAMKYEGVKQIESSMPLITIKS
jgi:hypothetical protein